MNTKSLGRFATVGLFKVTAIYILHFFLIRWLADRHVVERIFAAGDNVSISTLMVAGVFIVVRLLAVLVVPGMILCRLGLYFIQNQSFAPVRKVKL